MTFEKAFTITLIASEPPDTGEWKHLMLKPPPIDLEIGFNSGSDMLMELADTFLFSSDESYEIDKCKLLEGPSCKEDFTDKTKL